MKSMWFLKSCVNILRITNKKNNLNILYGMISNLTFVLITNKKDNYKIQLERRWESPKIRQKVDWVVPKKATKKIDGTVNKYITKNWNIDE